MLSPVRGLLPFLCVRVKFNLGFLLCAVVSLTGLARSVGADDDLLHGRRDQHLGALCVGFVYGQCQRHGHGDKRTSGSERTYIQRFRQCAGQRQRFLHVLSLIHI